MIKGSYDFIGLNYYTASYARAHPMSDTYTPQLSISDSYADQLGTFKQIRTLSHQFDSLHYFSQELIIFPPGNYDISYCYSRNYRKIVSLTLI